MLLNLPFFHVFRNCAVFNKLVNLIQSSYIFIINASLKAVVCFSMGLHVTHVDSVLYVSELTVQVHIKLFLHDPFLIQKIAQVHKCVTEMLIFSLMYKPIFLPSITYCICNNISWRSWNLFLMLIYC